VSVNSFADSSFQGKKTHGPAALSPAYHWQS
jgi:hypothetical protein